MNFEMVCIGSLVTFLSNAWVPIWINRKTLHTYFHTQSIETALHKMNTLKNIFLHPSHILGSISFFILLWQMPEPLAPGRWLSYGLLIGYVASIVIYSHLVAHPVVKQLRNTETQLKDELWASIKDLAIILLPIVAYKLLRISAQIHIHDTELKKFSFYVVFVFIFQAMYPYLTYLHLGAMPIRNPRVKQSILSFLDTCQAKQIQVYEFPAKKRKAAHAWVSGLWVKKIFIADYVIEQLTGKELQAVIAHEVGHCKKYHHLIMLVLLVASYPLLSIIGVLWEWMENWLNIGSSIGFGLFFFACVCCLYYVFFLQWISRKHEHQADQYVLNFCEKNDYISALYKLTRLNHQLTKFHKLIEKLHTHPSLENRIKRLEKVYRCSK